MEQLCNQPTTQSSVVSGSECEHLVTEHHPTQHGWLHPETAMQVTRPYLQSRPNNPPAQWPQDLPQRPWLAAHVHNEAQNSQGWDTGGCSQQPNFGAVSATHKVPYVSRSSSSLGFLLQETLETPCDHLMTNLRGLETSQFVDSEHRVSISLSSAT